MKKKSKQTKKETNKTTKIFSKGSSVGFELGEVRTVAESLKPWWVRVPVMCYFPLYAVITISE